MQKLIFYIITLINFTSWSIACDENNSLARYKAKLFKENPHLIAAHQDALQKATTLHDEKLNALYAARHTLLITYNPDTYKAHRLADYAETDAREALIKAQRAFNEQVDKQVTYRLKAEIALQQTAKNTKIAAQSTLQEDSSTLKAEDKEEHKKKDLKYIDAMYQQIIDPRRLNQMQDMLKEVNCNTTLQLNQEQWSKEIYDQQITKIRNKYLHDSTIPKLYAQFDKLCPSPSTQTFRKTIYELFKDGIFI